MHVCSDKELPLEMSAIHQTSQAKSIPYQPLLIKPVFTLTHFVKTGFPVFAICLDDPLNLIACVGNLKLNKFDQGKRSTLGEF